RIDAHGLIMYASPNAVSAYRRLGVTANLVGEELGSLGIDEGALLERVHAGRPVSIEIEANGAWVLRRFIPIVHRGSYEGALGFIRDTTDLRRRDRMLLLKDATIREIHHRVKNNLQTVASLLRMQTRRVGSSEAKEALEESIRRISSIALVHETLSQDSHELVGFDSVAQRVLDMVGESLAGPDRPVRFSLAGSAGDLTSDVATPLALILNELCQNAVDHAFGPEGGTVAVTLERRGLAVRMTVADDGRGLPQGFTLEETASLGLQIVRTLVESELGGKIDMTADGGTIAMVDIPLAQPS
ncbi:MAG: sensor histidine kinase, partial [Steroidobacteraceae bacterium]